MLAIVDSGGANIASVRFALERLGVQSELTADPAVIRGAERVILPGVGSAQEGMKRLQAKGLVVDHDGGEFTVHPRAVERPEDAGIQDYIVIALKAQSVPPLADKLAPMMGPQTAVVMAVNGVPWWYFYGIEGPLKDTRLASVDPGDRQWNLISPERVIGCVVHASCFVERPGHVRHVMGNGLLVGEAAGGTSQAVDDAVALLQRAGLGARAVDSVQREVFYKLWGNMTTNPVSALTRATTDRILADDLVREFTTAIMREAAQIGERVGCPIAQSPQDRHVITRSLGAFKTSMLQDIEAGRAIETDALLAAPRELAQQLGIATPMLDALLGLTRLMDRCRPEAR